MRTEFRGLVAWPVVFALLLLVAPRAVAQQGTAILQGSVLDGSKAALPTTVLRGGYGIYHSRARMFMQALASDQLTSESFVAVVTDPQRLRNYPNINAILGGTPAQFAATGLRSMANLVANDFEVPYAHNATLGFTRQFTDTLSLSIDGVYSHSNSWRNCSTCSTASTSDHPTAR